MDFLSEDNRRNPFPLYAHMRSNAPVFNLPRTDYWMLLDYASVKQVLSDPATFSSAITPRGSRTGQWLIFADPPRHTKLRGLIMRAFTSRAVANLEPRIRELARELLDRTAARGEMDLVADFSMPLPMMVIAEMLGAPLADWPTFKRWSDAILGLIHTVSGGAEGDRAVAAFGAVTEEMTGYLARLVEERRAEPKDDLLTRLVEAEVDGERLAEEELLGFFQLLLLAGHETTSNLIANAIICFMEHPDQLARVQADPALLPSAVEEVLRYRSPVQLVFRVPVRDVELSGRMVPAGKLLMVMIGAANHDPAQFDEPERFDVAREPNQHIAFGHGIHFCVGAPLARLEARVALEEFLERVVGFEHASSEPWPPREAFHVHGPTHLPLRFQPNGNAVAEPDAA